MDGSLVLPACAAGFLLTMGLMTNTPNAASALLFRVVPVALGGALAVQTAAQVMGWPL